MIKVDRNKVIAYGACVVAGLAIGVGITTRSLLKREQEVSTLHTQLLEKELEVSNLRTQLSIVESKNSVTEETVERKKDGSETIRRVTKVVEDRKSDTVVEEKKEVQTERQLAVQETVQKETLTAPAQSGEGRLGLNLGIATRLDTELRLSYSLDLSYEVGYRIAPRVGVEFTGLTGGLKAGTLGLEIRL